MTRSAAKTGRDTVSAVSRPAASTPRLESIHHAAKAALTEFAAEQRLVGSVMAHESFDGILAEHALALEEARDNLRDGLALMPITRGLHVRSMVDEALRVLDEQIRYLRALGSVAEPNQEES